MHDFGQLLKVVARGTKTAFGKPFTIGTFFNSYAEKKKNKKQTWRYEGTPGKLEDIVRNGWRTVEEQ